MKKFIVLAAFFASALSGLCIDVGDPIFRKDVGGPIRIELLHESYDREVKFSFDEGEFRDDFEADIFLARFSYLPSEQTTIYLDAGIIDSDIAESSAPIFGGGLRYMASENRWTGLRVTIFGNAYHAPSFDTKVRDADSIDEGQADFFKIGGGILFSGMQEMDGDSKVIPYAGLLISIINGSYESTYTAIDDGYAIDTNADIEQEDLFSGVLGLSFLINPSFSVRVEGRFIGQTSLSIAIGAAF